MKENQIASLQRHLPLKSVAGALLFSAFLGPIGLLYASVFGGALLTALCFVSMSGKFYVTTAMFWALSCIWSVASVNRYNRRLIKSAVTA